MHAVLESERLDRLVVDDAEHQRVEVLGHLAVPLGQVSGVVRVAAERGFPAELCDFYICLDARVVDGCGEVELPRVALGRDEVGDLLGLDVDVAGAALLVARAPFGRGDPTRGSAAGLAGITAEPCALATRSLFLLMALRLISSARSKSALSLSVLISSASDLLVRSIERSSADICE
jgi:hypothetical protein